MRCVLTLFASFCAAAIGSAANAAVPIGGHWVTQDGKAVVAIEQCGEVVCGKVVRLLPAAKGGPTTDVRNTDPTLRNRPMLGLPILSGFVDDGAEWRGTIYNPEEGKTYKAFVSRAGDGSLKVRGCWYFLCRNVVWRPAP